MTLEFPTDPMKPAKYYDGEHRTSYFNEGYLVASVVLTSNCICIPTHRVVKQLLKITLNLNIDIISNFPDILLYFT